MIEGEFKNQEPVKEKPMQKIKKFYRNHKDICDIGAIMAYNLAWVCFGAAMHKYMTNVPKPVDDLSVIFFNKDGQDWMVMGGKLFKKN